MNKQLHITRLFPVFLLILGLLATAGSQTIRKADEPNASITARSGSFGSYDVRGTGFYGFEMVEISVFRSGNPRAMEFFAGRWTVTTDGTGSFSTNISSLFATNQYVVRAVGMKSGLRGDFRISQDQPVTEAASANLDQCANGEFGFPLVCTGDAWVNGNVNENKAHYFEGEAVSYRLRFDGLTTVGVHRVDIEWDTTEGGKHALDYLTSYDHSETDAEPCSGVVGCDASTFDTFNIPADLWVTRGTDGIPGNGDDIAQIPGVFTLYNGSIISVSGYMRSGTFDGNSKASISIQFTASTANPVLAWGGHISTRLDWGANNSAIAISGSPYHMRFLSLDGSGGNQDRSLSSSAAIFPGTISIVKDSQPNTILAFNFTATGPGVSNFTLDDNGSNTDTYSNTKLFENLVNFGSANPVTITEDQVFGVFSLGDIICTSDPSGGTGTNNNDISLADSRVTVTLEEGENVQCTFVNLITVPSAADVTLSGRVYGNNGRGLPNADLTLISIDGATFQARSNLFGYFQFFEVPAGESYVLSISAKGYYFSPDTMVITPEDDMAGLDFVGYRGHFR